MYLAQFSLGYLLAQIDGLNAANRPAGQGVQFRPGIEPARKFKKDASSAPPSQPATGQPGTESPKPSSSKLVPFDVNNRASVSNAISHGMQLQGIPHSHLATVEGRDFVKQKVRPLLARDEPRILNPDGAANFNIALHDLARPLPHRLDKLHPAARPNPILPEESRPKLEPHEREALNRYSFLTDGVINNSLRRGDPIYHPGFAADHRVMQKALARTKPFKQPVTVHRGIALPSQEALEAVLDQARHAYDTNKPMVLRGYTSTSTKPSNYFTVSSDIQFVIKSKHGLDLKPHSDKSGESELLMQPNTRLQVHRVYFDNRRNRWIVEGEQLLPGEKPMSLDDKLVRMEANLDRLLAAKRRTRNAAK